MTRRTTMKALLLTIALAACGSSATPPANPTPPAPEPRAQPDADRPAPSDAKATALAAETAAYEKAKPVFEKYCGECHTKAGKKSAKKKLDHFDMDTYPFGGEHTAFIGNHIRDVLGLTGKKATMPDDKPGAVQGDDLALVVAWADAWDSAESAGAHPPHGEDPDKD